MGRTIILFDSSRIFFSFRISSNWNRYFDFEQLYGLNNQQSQISRIIWKALQELNVEPRSDMRVDIYGNFKRKSVQVVPGVKIYLKKEIKTIVQVLKDGKYLLDDGKVIDFQDLNFVPDYECIDCKCMFASILTNMLNVADAFPWCEWREDN